METKKNIGIWMDHSNANLIDLNDPKNNRTITSDFTNTVKEAVLSRSEFTLHNKEQQMNEQFLFSNRCCNFRIRSRLFIWTHKC